MEPSSPALCPSVWQRDAEATTVSGRIDGCGIIGDDQGAALVGIRDSIDRRDCRDLTPRLLRTGARQMMEPA
jgi:hypothetical protein